MLRRSELDGCRSVLTGATSVTFNGVPATFTPGSDTQLTAVVPAGATSGTLSITTPQGTVTSTSILTILAPPTVSSFSPASGVIGATVTISGSHLGGSPSVRFNGVSATALSSSDSSITVQVPSSATSGPISVTSSGGTVTASGSFTVLVPPTFSGLSPGSGAPGTTVTVYGAQFTGATSVTVNGATAQFSVVSDSQLTVTVPAGATTGPIGVTTPTGSASSSSVFTVSVTAAPTISGLSPGSAPVGTAVTIAGAHFTGATSVKFNGITASFVVNSDSQITTTIPSTATSGAVTVTTAAGTVTSTSFVISH